MGIESQVGITSVFLLVAFVVIGIYNQSIVQDGIFFQILINIQIALLVGVSVWFLTTSRDRQNRKYIRNRTATEYLNCVAISGVLVSEPTSRTDIVELTDNILHNYDRIIDRVRSQAHLLSALELDNFIAQKSTILDFFIPALRNNPNDDELLDSFQDFFRTVLSDYASDHKLKEFSEYVLDQ